MTQRLRNAAGVGAHASRAYRRSAASLRDGAHTQSCHLRGSLALLGVSAVPVSHLPRNARLRDVLAARCGSRNFGAHLVAHLDVSRKVML